MRRVNRYFPEWRYRWSALTPRRLAASSMGISSSCLFIAGTGVDSRIMAVARITSNSPSSSGNSSGCIFGKLSNTDLSCSRMLACKDQQVPVISSHSTLVALPVTGDGW